MSARGLTRTIRTLFSQDVALRNAALASARLLRERRQRADVDEFLARLDAVVAAQQGAPADGRAARLDAPAESRGPAGAPAGIGAARR